MELVIPKPVYEKIMYWVNKSEYEVSGLGKISTGEDGKMTVLDVMLLPQKNAHTHTDIEAEDVAKAMYTLRNAPGDLRFWWHSHVNMQVFWSGTDKDTIKLCGQGGWCVATVFNKKYEKRSAFYSVNGVMLPWKREELFLDEIKTTIEFPINPNVAAWDQEYELNVTNKRYGGRGGSLGELGAASTTQNSMTQTSGGSGTTAGGADITKLSKKEQRRLKKLARNASKSAGQTVTQQTLELVRAEQHSDMRATTNDDVPIFDDDDIKVFKAAGWTDEDIELLEDEEYFSVVELLEFAHADWSPSEVMGASHYASKNDISAETMIKIYMPKALRSDDDEEKLKSQNDVRKRLGMDPMGPVNVESIVVVQ